VAGIVLVCAAVYANSLGNPLLRDDKTAVVNDRRANDPRLWREIFTQNYWHGLNTDPIYRPVTTLSFLVNRMVAGPHPWGYRIVNVALHAGVCIAVYLLGLRLLGTRWAAWLAAMLFAVHAVHSEAVTAIVGRADMAVTLLLVAVAWLMLGRPARGGCQTPRWLAVLGLTAVALFCKETAFAVLPLVVLIQIWQGWGRDRNAERPLRSRRYLVGELYLAASVAAVCIAALVIRNELFGRLSRPGRLVPLVDNPLGHAGPLERVLTSVGLLGRYLRLLAWPHPLCCDYSYNQIPVAQGLTDPAVLLGLAWIAGIGVMLCLVWRSAPARGWQVAIGCIAFFVVTYGPISNAVVVIGTIFGERLIYLPSVGWCLAFGALATGLARRVGCGGRIGIGIVCAAILLVNAGLTVRRNMDWRDRLTLWTQAVHVCPGSNRCWSNLSKAYQANQQLGQAVTHMRHALAIHDDEWADHLVLGEQLGRLGQYQQAAIAVARAYELARGRFRIRPAYQLGQLYTELGQPAQAILAYEAVLGRDPNHIGALNNLAYLQATTDPPLRDLDAAAAHIERVLALVPNELEFLDTAVDVYLARRQRDRALQLVRRALSVGDRRHPLYARFRQRLEQLTGTTPPTTRP